MQYVLCRVEDDGSSSFVSEHDTVADGIAAAVHMVEVVDFDFAYRVYSDVGNLLASFREGRIGYRQWAHRRGYINSLDDKYEHDVDVALS